VITLKHILIVAGIIALIGSTLYFRYVGPFSSPLSSEQQEAIATQRERIADLEAQNEKADREVKIAKAAQMLAELREREATGRLAQRNQEIAEWTAKYAELKSRPAQLITKADEARAALRQMGWSQ